MIEFDLKTGQERNLTMNINNTGSLEYVIDTSLNAENDTIFLTMNSHNAIYAYDIESETLKIISGENKGKGQILESPQGIISTPNNIIYTYVDKYKTLLEIDATTGDRLIWQQ